MQYRTHFTVDLVDVPIGEEVTVAGWVARRRDHGGVAFLDIRDGKGLVQVVVDPGKLPHVDELRMEYTVSLTGEVKARPEGTVNPELVTGEVEVHARELVIHSRSEEHTSELQSR